MSNNFTLGKEMEFAKLVTFEQGTPEWLEWRTGGLGGSDVAAIIGESPWMSILYLWSVKAKVFKDEKLNDSEDMKWRHKMEPMIALEYLERHPECTLEAVSPCFQREDHPWMRVSLDRITADQFGNINTEIKTAASEDGWLTEDGEPTVPAYYMAQALWQMMVTGIKRTRFAVFIAGFNKRYFEREVEYNEDAAEILFEAAASFWVGVLENTPPPPDLNNPTSDKEAIKHIFAKVDPDKVCTLSNDFYTNIQRRARLKEQLEHIKNEIDTIENGIKMLGGNASLVQTEDGRKICSKIVVTKVSITPEDLKRANEPLYIRLKNTTSYPKWNFSK